MQTDNYILICLKNYEVFIGSVHNDDLLLLGKATNLKDAISIAQTYEKILWHKGSVLQYGIHFYDTLKGFTIIREEI